MKKSLFVLLVFVACLGIFAQDKPLTAVMPFGSRNVSESDAAIITSLFETALVKTDSFLVIEQNQVAEILDAQAYTLTGCTDEACAVEFGKLLAAEQIILGEFSRLGGRYFINAKVIDVERGENIRADSVSADSLEEISGMAELLAFTLAGLTYSQGGTTEIAREFGDLFIETTPPGAEIFINGVAKGQSPNLFQRVPLGEVVVEARFEELYAREVVDLQEGVAEITLELRETYGNLYVKATDSELEVYLDGESLGALGSGFFRDIQAGRHSLALDGNGLYWDGEVHIVEDESTVVEPQLRSYGSISLDLPPESIILLTGTEGRYQFSTENMDLSRIWAGDYQVEISGSYLEDFSGNLSVVQGETLDYQPDIILTMDPELTRIMDEIDDIARQVPVLSSLDAFEDLYKDYTDLRKDLDQDQEMALEAGLNQLLISLMTKKVQLLENRIGQLRHELEAQGGSGRSKALPRILEGLGVASLITSGVCFYLMQENFDKYQNAQLTDDAVSFREDTESFRNISIGTAAAGLVLGTAGIILDVRSGGGAGLEREIEKLEEEKAEAQTQLSLIQS